MMTKGCRSIDFDVWDQKCWEAEAELPFLQSEFPWSQLDKCEVSSEANLGDQSKGRMQEKDSERESLWENFQETECKSWKMQESKRKRGEMQVWSDGRAGANIPQDLGKIICSW